MRVVTCSVEDWLLEIVRAVGWFFVHPVFYLFIISSFLVGYTRVLRERQDFSAKIYDVWYELRTSMFKGVGIGFIFSLIMIGIGFVLSKGSLAVIMLVTVLFAVLQQYRLLSSAYTIGVSLFVLAFFSDIKLPLMNSAIGDGTSYSALAVLLALLLFAEGTLISKYGAYASTPKLLKGKRGRSIGLHVCKRMWLVPVFFVVPGDSITHLFAWWPVVTVGTKTFSLMLLPLGIGFSKTIKGMLPSEAISFTGRRVRGLSILVLLLAAGSFWLTGLAVAAAGIAILGRMTIAIREQLEDEKLPAFFTSKNIGLMILDIIPDSPAEEIGLKTGEIITKVNGVTPRTIGEFYQALQRNSAGAYCKLEILDTNGELRLRNRALFQGDHHKLGLVFVEQDFDRSTEAV
ncbi:PDZ domain-containing protein [Bacillus sp. 165]|uniref:PDZ domain-containing protein n=1 Tax=Bacillus sp. 165 TaxID=1529117 RepID=UPI001ADD2081|nr:PDZ domain-containing protein [Bacillus sp. 165]MBO9129939.1 PDZ domain-containing protein [Bacillus sp. 165]